MKNFTTTLLTLITIICFTSCKENVKEQDKTPVVNEDDLRDLNPNESFDDMVTVFSKLEKNPDYNSLLKLVNQAHMFDAIKNLDDVTFFAPTNAAISRLNENTYNNLRLPENIETLQSILKYHIVKGETDSATLLTTLKAQETPKRLETLNGSFISLQLIDNKIVITDENGNKSEISEADIEASNGVIHGITNVLIPVNK